MNTDKINGIGTWLNPTLGLIAVLLLGWLKSDVSKIDTHFTNHLKHHTKLEVKYEGRITTLEGVSVIAVTS